MKQNKLTTSIFILGALALMAGGVVAAEAASDSFKGKMLGLSEEERAVKIEEVEARRAVNRVDAELNREEVLVAISANNYEGWKAAIGENHPFAEKVTEANFSTFVEAHNLMEEARSKFREIGIENQGFGMARGHGMGGFGGMR
jgi:hypothetical protein